MQEREYPKSKDQWRGLPLSASDDRLDIGNFQVMQRWEEPLMLAMANEVMGVGGDILEVGFGMGISAGMVMAQMPKSYTVIEAHPEVANRAREWGDAQPAPVTVHEGFAQDVAPQLTERFDGILFDPYPNSKEAWYTYHLEFMPIAYRLLRPGGIFVYFAGQTSRFSEEHAETMLDLFNEVRLLRVNGLRPPADCDYWNADYMVLASGRRDRQ